MFVFPIVNWSIQYTVGNRRFSRTTRNSRHFSRALLSYWFRVTILYFHWNKFKKVQFKELRKQMMQASTGQYFIVKTYRNFQHCYEWRQNAVTQIQKMYSFFWGDKSLWTRHRDVPNIALPDTEWHQIVVTGNRPVLNNNKKQDTWMLDYLNPIIYNIYSVYITIVFRDYISIAHIARSI